MSAPRRRARVRRRAHGLRESEVEQALRTIRENMAKPRELRFIPGPDGQLMTNPKWEEWDRERTKG
jgi:hypothetical protein